MTAAGGTTTAGGTTGAGEGSLRGCGMGGGEFWGRLSVVAIVTGGGGTGSLTQVYDTV